MVISDVFIGKKVFITGGSGFLGKVLIEKLLRSCPGVENIYVLIRNKRGKSPKQRLDDIKSEELFESVREADPECLNKLIAIPGDMTKIRLGMSDDDWNFIAENVNIIYNGAASVKFDDPLKYAIFINVRSAREVCRLALETKNLNLFCHISTTYCNTDKKVIEEKIYPPHIDWRTAIQLAEECDEMLLQTLTEKFIDPLPNTYTFAKSLAEHVVEDMCKGRIPSFILRPSVVISIIEDPIYGWIDNMNGPVGLLVAGGKGLLRTIWGQPESCQDYIPVDLVIKTIIIASMEKMVNGNKDELEVYNCSQYDRRPIPVGRIVEMGRDLIWDSPFPRVIWYPRFSMTRCWYSYYLQVLLCHMLPAIFLDMLMALAGQKRMFVKIQRKIYIANVVLEYFIRNTWEFKHDRTIKLEESVSPEDYKDWSITKFVAMTDKEIYQYFRGSKIATMRFIIKEKFTQDKSRKMIWWLWLLDSCVWSVVYLYLTWLLVVKMDILNVVFNSVKNYSTNLPA